MTARPSSVRVYGPAGLAVAVVLCAGLASHARAQDEDEATRLDEGEFTAEQLLPEDTLALLNIPDVTAMANAWRGSPLHRIFTRDDVRGVWRKVRRVAQREREAKKFKLTLLDLLDQIDLTPERLTQLFPEQFTFAVFPVQGELRWALVAACSGDEQRRDVERLLNDFFSAMSKAGYAVDPQPDTYRDLVDLETWQTTFGVFAHHFVGNLFVLTQGRDTIVSIFDRALGRDTRALATRPYIVRRLAELERGQAQVFFDLSGLREKISDASGFGDAFTLQLPASWQPVPPVRAKQDPAAVLLPAIDLLRAGGLLNLRFQFEPEGVREHMLYTPARDAELLTFINRAPLLRFDGRRRLRTSKFVPIDAHVYLAAHFNLHTWLDRRLAADNPLRKVTGIFSGEAGFATFPTDERAGRVAILELSDDGDQDEKYDQAERVIVEEMAKQAGHELRPSRSRAFDIFSTVATAAARARLPYPDVAFNREQKSVVLAGTTVSHLRKAIRQSRHPDSSIRRREDYRWVIKRLGQDRPFSLRYYADAKKLLNQAYLKHGGRFQEMAKDQGWRWELAFDKILTKEIKGTGIQLRVEDNALVVEAASSVGFVPLMVALKGVGRIGAAEKIGVDPEVRQLRAGKLVRIGVGLHLYAADFDRFPLKLSELHATYVPDLETFEINHRETKIRTGPDIDTKSDFLYISGLSLTDVADRILVYERRLDVDGYRWFLPLFGRPMYINQEMFRDRVRWDGLKIDDAEEEELLERKQPSFLTIP